MDLIRAIKGVLQSPSLLCLILFYAVLAVFSVFLYFRAVRPRRGTTEWMRRVDPKSFQKLPLHKLTGADGLWAILAAVCAAGLRLFYLFFWLRLHQRPNAAQVLLSALPFLAERVLLCVLFSLAVYFFLRLLFGKPLPAICAAAIGGFVQNQNNDTAAFLMISLLFFYCWMAASYDGSFLRGLWLLASMVFFALCLLTCWHMFWLAPLYLVGYIAVQILRYRGGNRETRGKKLRNSLLLCVLGLLIGSLCLWLAYSLLSGRASQGAFEALRSFRFYQDFFPVLVEKLKSLLVSKDSLLSFVVASDVFLFVAGIAACVPLAHSIWKEKNSEALLAGLLLIAFTLLWLISDVYLLAIPLLFILGWLWSVYCQRDRRGYAAGSACVVLLFHVLCMFVH